jgi:hypothetical protein
LKNNQTKLLTVNRGFFHVALRGGKLSASTSMTSGLRPSILAS